VPPVVARPVQLNLTDIERLIRDPYAIYARTILRLRPLDSLTAEPDAGDRGTLFHRVLERFVQERPAAPEDLQAARGRLMATAERVLRADMPSPTHRVLWLARLDLAADHFLAEDRRLTGATVGVEVQGSLMVPPVGVTLKGRLDRIDRQADGSLVLIDYKSGEVPSIPQQQRFAKQLLVAAAMVERGAFALPPPLQVGEIRYVGIGAKAKTVDSAITETILAETWAGLVQLLAHYRSAGSGFTARRAMVRREDVSDYDHLSRFGEWDISDAAEGVILGGEDA
jgi:ATP-dependent helicase/nuclease subunit B